MLLNSFNIDSTSFQLAKVGGGGGGCKWFQNHCSTNVEVVYPDLEGK